MGGPRSKSHRGDPIIPDIDGYFQCLQGEDSSRLDGGPIKDVRETFGIEQGFLDEVVRYWGKSRVSNLLFESKSVSLTSRNLTAVAVAMRVMIHKEGCDARILFRFLKQSLLYLRNQKRKEKRKKSYLFWFLF